MYGSENLLVGQAAVRPSTTQAAPGRAIASNGHDLVAEHGGGVVEVEVLPAQAEWKAQDLSGFP